MGGLYYKKVIGVYKAFVRNDLTNPSEIDFYRKWLELIKI
jgi:hypothetical protein